MCLWVGHCGTEQVGEGPRDVDQGSGFGRDRCWCTGERVGSGGKNRGPLPSPASGCLVDGGDREISVVGMIRPVGPDWPAGWN